MTDIASAEHRWSFSAVRIENNIYAVGVCERCGAARSALAGRNEKTRYIWLGEACPGTPQAQERREPRVIG